MTHNCQSDHQIHQLSTFSQYLIYIPFTFIPNIWLVKYSFMCFQTKGLWKINELCLNSRFGQHWAWPFVWMMSHLRGHRCRRIWSPGHMLRSFCRSCNSWWWRPQTTSTWSAPPTSRSKTWRHVTEYICVGWSSCHQRPLRSMAYSG